MKLTEELTHEKLPGYTINDKAESHWEVVGPDGLVHRHIEKNADDSNRPDVLVSELNTAIEAERGLLALALTYIDAHFKDKPKFDAIAKRVKLSPFHFHRRFALVFGMTPKAAVDKLRIAEAKRLMLAGRTTLPDIAKKLSFAHQSHFTARFKQLVGKTPTRWLRDEQKLQRDAQQKPIAAAA